jgi:signal peptidase II
MIMLPMNRLRVLVLLSTFLCVGCDHVTKHLAKQAYENQPPKPLVGNVLDLTYTENRDCGFGLLRAVPENIRKPILTSLQLGTGIIVLALALRRKVGRSLRAAFVLISAGAMGNGIDRIARGYVVDFVHLHYWPVFNAADVYITVGMVLFVLASWRRTSAPAERVSL